MHGRDPHKVEMEGRMPEWVAETVLQGTHMREYHLWEKGYKAYFPRMASRNGNTLTMKSKGGQSFTDLAALFLRHRTGYVWS